MSSPRVCFHWLLSSLLVLWITFASAARAHEVLPAIADMTAEPDRLSFSVRLSIEGFIAGIDLGTIADTNEAPEAATYDELRALSAEALQTRFEAFWPEMARNIRVLSEGTALPVTLDRLTADPVGDPEFPRISTLEFSAALPQGTAAVEVGWSSEYGALVLRQMGVDAPYDGYIEAGSLSAPIALAGGDQAGALDTFLSYIPVGFDHIIPKGLDHILFVLGLFFLSTRLGPLLWQISAFTLAHTVTLAAGALGYVTIPGSIVEPIIAASIVYVAVENILTDGLNRWRPFVVFGFGLLHGLGFASVLGEFGLPETAFLPALIGFNVGVELGQLTVIAIAFATLGYWFGGKSWYRKAIAIPASALIALVGAWWFVERVFL